MRKFIYLGIITLVLFFILAICPPGSPEYLYRCLDIKGYDILHLGGLTTTDSTFSIRMKHVEWFGGAWNHGNAYYQSDDVNDQLYGYFSMPVLEYEGQVIIDSMHLCVYTQANGDHLGTTILYHYGCVSYKSDSIFQDIGDGTNGWVRELLTDVDLTAADSCYKIGFQCVNDGANDIRLRPCIEIKYHLE